MIVAASLTRFAADTGIYLRLVIEDFKVEYSVHITDPNFLNQGLACHYPGRGNNDSKVVGVLLEFPSRRSMVELNLRAISPSEGD